MKRKRDDDDDDERVKKKRRVSRALTSVDIESGYNYCINLFKNEIKKTHFNDINSSLKNEQQFKSGNEKLKKFLEFCLVTISNVFPYTELQFEMFLKTIPIILPLLYGREFYNSYKTPICKTLGVNHEKLCYWFTGARRDGKSIFQGSIGAAILCICEGGVFISFLGPAEKTGRRINDNISLILDLDIIKETYTNLTFKKTIDKLVVINTNTGNKNKGKVIATTTKSLRGVSPNILFIDEAKFIDPQKFETLFIPLLKQSGIGSLSITTQNPDPNFDYYKKFDESTNVFECDCKARVCKDCVENCTTFEEFNEVIKKCQDLGHVEPPNVPWINNKYEKDWSYYQSTTNIGAEHGGVCINNDNMGQFDHKKLKSFFSQVVYEPYCGYSYFFGGFDPSDCGKSETSVWFLGYNNETFHIVYGNSYIVNNTQSVPELMFEDIRYFIEKFNVKHKKTYLFIESFGHHGNEIQRRINDNRFNKFVKVLKGIKIHSKNPNDWGYGIPKTKDYTEKYVSDLRSLLNNNRIKISKKFLTRNKNGKKEMLNKLHIQMKRFVRNKKGKLTGKGNGNENDDCICALMMIPTNANKCFNVTHPYNFQLCFDDEMYTF